MNDELVHELGKLPTDMLGMLNEALQRYITHGRWNGYNRHDVERVAQLPEHEKEEAISQIRVNDNGPELTAEQRFIAERFIDGILDAMCISEAREESSKMLTDLEHYLRHEEQ